MLHIFPVTFWVAAEESALRQLRLFSEKSAPSLAEMRTMYFFIHSIYLTHIFLMINLRKGSPPACLGSLLPLSSPPICTHCVNVSDYVSG